MTETSKKALETLAKFYHDMGSFLDKQNEIELKIIELEKDLKNKNLLINKLNEQISEIKENTILSKDNRNTNGRPTLTDEEVEFIKARHKEGLTQRRIADMIQVSVGSVNKYVKETKNDLEEQFTTNVFEQLEPENKQIKNSKISTSALDLF